MSPADQEPFLAVDIGNNQVKLGLFPPDDGQPMPHPIRIQKLSAADTPFEILDAWLPTHRLLWYVATVQRRIEQRLAGWVRNRRPQDAYLRLANEQLPIAIHVDQPARVGTDRLLAAVAVNACREPTRPAIVIDAGSAITVDLVSAQGAFEGGVILPGLGMVAAALAERTDLLPLVDQTFAAEPPPVVGKSTVAAIRSGLFWGNVGAVRELVSRIAQELSTPPQLFIAGGDAERIAALVSPQARVAPELVLAGIALTRRALR
jgi:type III pantothenate kinase